MLQGPLLDPLLRIEDHPSDGISSVNEFLVHTSHDLAEFGDLIL
jgi:hypothetical protein